MSLGGWSQVQSEPGGTTRTRLGVGHGEAVFVDALTGHHASTSGAQLLSKRRLTWSKQWGWTYDVWVDDAASYSLSGANGRFSVQAVAAGAIRLASQAAAMIAAQTPAAAEALSSSWSGLQQQVQQQVQQHWHPGTHQPARQPDASASLHQQVQQQLQQHQQEPTLEGAQYRSLAKAMEQPVQSLDRGHMRMHSVEHPTMSLPAHLPAVESAAEQQPSGPEQHDHQQPRQCSRRSRWQWFRRKRPGVDVRLEEHITHAKELST